MHVFVWLKSTIVYELDKLINKIHADLNPTKALLIEKWQMNYHLKKCIDITVMYECMEISPPAKT